MQKVLLIGYLGRDPELKYSQQGTAIAQFCHLNHQLAADWKHELAEIRPERVAQGG